MLDKRQTFVSNVINSLFMWRGTTRSLVLITDRKFLSSLRNFQGGFINQVKLFQIFEEFPPGIHNFNKDKLGAVCILWLKLWLVS